MKYLVLKEFDEKKLALLDEISEKQKEFDVFKKCRENFKKSIVDEFMETKKKQSNNGKVYCIDVRELGTDEDIASGTRARFCVIGNVFCCKEEAENFLDKLFDEYNQ